MTELTLAWLVLILGTALVAGLHPMLVSTLPLVLGSMLGNNFHLRRALRGIVFFMTLLLVEWLMIGATVASILQRNESEVLFYVIATFISIIGALELKSAISNKGFAMQLSERPWRRVRKHAYRVTRTSALIKLNLHMLPWIAALTGSAYLGTLTLASRTSEATSLLLVGLYSITFIVPFCVLAALITTTLRLSDIHHWISRYSPLLHLLQAVVLFTLSALLTLYGGRTN